MNNFITKEDAAAGSPAYRENSAPADGEIPSAAASGSSPAPARIGYLDAARGLAILLIVFGHVLKDGTLRQVVFSCNVPVFFLLAGQTYRFDPDFRRFALHRARRIVLPYFAVSLVSIALYRVLGQAAAGSLGVKTRSTTLLQDLFGMVYANSRNGFMKWNLPLWFLPCLFTTILLADAAERLLQEPTVRTRLILIFSFLACGFLIRQFLPSLALPWCIEIALYMASFYECGILITEKGLMKRLLRFTRRTRQLNVFLFVALLCGITIDISLANGFAQVRNMDVGRSFWLLTLSSVTGGAALLLLAVPLRKIQLLKRAGRGSLAILLFHKFPILFFQTICPGTKTLLKHGSSAGGILCALAVTAVTAALCLAVAVGLRVLWLRMPARTGRGTDPSL
ncbi:MAG: acyltransferase [Lachnospiraceae bacterium]|jgi:fucose 4-O-acetylase-like acetyltransferase|nr:acyltransferase [Lachnospiraceae bacterium]